MWQPKTLTGAEVKFLHEFLEELDALVDADDGTCFMCRHIDMLETAKEILGADAEEGEEENGI